MAHPAGLVSGPARPARRTKKKKVDVLDALTKSREHIVTKWVRGTWFVYLDEHDQKREEEHVPTGQPVVGVCAAGSVLYALDYTSEQWTNAEDVKPVIEALYDALPVRSRSLQRAKQEIADLQSGGMYVVGDDKSREQAIYDTKVGAITDYNDQQRRRKQEIVDLFDRAIENVRAATPILIQEQAL
jgi:hypothetical protein